jgi:hypothetical protein
MSYYLGVNLTKRFIGEGTGDISFLTGLVGSYSTRNLRINMDKATPSSWLAKAFPMPKLQQKRNG